MPILEELEEPPGSSGSKNSSVNELDKDNKRFIRTYGDPNQKTPYQGNRRTFGFFHCLTCKTDWASANTWANMGQECFTCMENIYPYRQIPHRKRSGDKKRKPHPQSHCEMCKTLNQLCQHKMIINQKQSSGVDGDSGSGKQSGSGDKKAKKKKPRRRNKKTADVPNEE